MARRSTLLVAAAFAMCIAANFVFGVRASPGEPLTAELSKTIELKDLTWVEVRIALRAGYDTVLVPTGGIEQNGPHMILGKHDYIVQWAANRIALATGRALVAPVVSYVPEGDYEPATGHMRFPGTLGVPESVFASVIEGIARSLKAHGFKFICFMGDHGGSQNAQRAVAARLSREWGRDRVRVVNLDAYYDDGVQVKQLEAEGETAAAIGQHATIIDTSELMAIHPAGVDLSRIPKPGVLTETPGSSGDPARASPERGQRLIAIRIDAAVREIEALRRPE
jgi:creatinine amidohydrolase